MTRRTAAHLALAAAAAPALADGPRQGTATWLWDVTTQDGDALVEPGETATLTLSILMEPKPGDGPFAALNAVIFGVVGDEAAYQGATTSFEVLHDLDDIADGGGVIFDGVSVLNILAGQLTVFGPFNSDNPIDVFQFEWQPDAYVPLDVGFDVVTELQTVHVWEGKDKDSAVSVPYAAVDSHVTFTVAPAPGAAALLAGAAAPRRRRRS